MSAANDHLDLVLTAMRQTAHTAKVLAYLQTADADEFLRIVRDRCEACPCWGQFCAAVQRDEVLQTWLGDGLCGPLIWRWARADAPGSAVEGRVS